LWLGDARTGKGLKTGPSHIRIIHRARDRSILEITIREGRNRQVRRMLAQLGHKVRDLIRVRMGPLTLEGLKTGQSRPLTQREVDALRKLAHSPVHAPRATAAHPPRPAKDPVPHGVPRGRDDNDPRMR
jgi:16S rRNA U516 pseudouridylate synthase RsuA-like enzyme